uniref:Uncharacterized protein n=1 Tax=Timema monikensis TaxID=170555 RepID=A0A7R9EGJ7_9NEOP|nr:unnamed protein product [Timema monikensis]
MLHVLADAVRPEQISTQDSYTCSWDCVDDSLGNRRSPSYFLLEQNKPTFHRVPEAAAMISGAGTYGDVIDLEAINLKKREEIERSLRDSKMVPDQPEKEVPKEEEKPVPKEPEKPVTPPRPKRDTKWPNVLIYIHLHVGALYGLFLIFNGAYFSTTLFGESLQYLLAHRPANRSGSIYLSESDTN